MALDKVIDSAKLDADLTSIADAIREKAGVSDSFAFPDGFVEAVSGISAGGGDNLATQIIEGTVTEINDNTATEIGIYAFYKTTSLSSTEYKLTSVKFSEATKVGNSAFYSNKALVSASFPKAQRIGNEVFSYCSSLSSVDIPSVTFLSTSCFQGCAALKSLYLPSVTRLGISVFSNCSALECIDFGKIEKFDESVFSNCKALNTLILRKASGISPLGSTGYLSATFFGTSGTGTGGICLVPRSLIESYQTATNWSTLYAGGKCLFWALEDYTVDGTTTGEINWDKLNADREGAFA